MVDSTMTLSAPTYGTWPTVDSLQVKEDARMAVMSAMVDNMDQNVGKLINKLKQMGKLDNTLIMFASDNGVCTEGSEDNTLNVHTSRKRMSKLFILRLVLKQLLNSILLYP